jgi:hypothetical protein
VVYVRIPASYALEGLLAERAEALLTVPEFLPMVPAEVTLVGDTAGDAPDSMSPPGGFAGGPRIRVFRVLL